MNLGPLGRANCIAGWGVMGARRGPWDRCGLYPALAVYPALVPAATGLGLGIGALGAGLAPATRK